MPSTYFSTFSLLMRTTIPTCVLFSDSVLLILLIYLLMYTGSCCYHSSYLSGQPLRVNITIYRYNYHRTAEQNLRAFLAATHRYRLYLLFTHLDNATNRLVTAILERYTAADAYRPDCDATHDPTTSSVPRRGLNDAAPVFLFSHWSYILTGRRWLPVSHLKDGALAGHAQALPRRGYALRGIHAPPSRFSPSPTLSQCRCWRTTHDEIPKRTVARATN